MLIISNTNNDSFENKNNQKNTKKGEVKSISDKARYTEAYHVLQSAVEAFSILSPHIPRVLQGVVSNIYQRFDNASYYLFRASNEPDGENKVKHLQEAEQDIFYQQSSFETLVKAKGLTVGGANTVLNLLYDAHEQTAKWLNTAVKSYKSLC